MHLLACGTPPVAALILTNVIPSLGSSGSRPVASGRHASTAPAPATTAPPRVIIGAKLRVVSHNGAGLKSPGKLTATLIEASKKDVDILLIQEHNLTAGDKELVAKTARERGYHHCVGYVNRHGGSAVFASMTTFPVPPPPMRASLL